MKKLFSLFLSGSIIICSCFCFGALKVESIAANNGEACYASEIVPYGGMIKDEKTDTVYYARKDDSEKYINPHRVPLYFASGIQNSCAITAGGAVIGHFDRVYEELIPNHTGMIFMGQFVYENQGEEVDAMHQELYKRMGSTSSGTTVAGFKSGMDSYIRSKGRTPEITRIYSWGSLNKSAYMSALEAGKLLTVFLDGFPIIVNGSFEFNDGYDSITNVIVEGLHTVTAYGYWNIKYYNSADKLIQEDCYLMVHTGFTTAGLAYIRLNKYTTIDDGYIINIT